MIHVYSNNCKTTRYVGKYMFLFSLCTNLLQIQKRSVPCFFFLFFFCCCSVVQTCPLPPHGLSTPGFPVLSTSWSLLKFLSIESVMPSNHLVLCCPFLLLPSILTASGSFPMNRLFPSGGQSIGASASASVLAVNI